MKPKSWRTYGLIGISILLSGCSYHLGLPSHSLPLSGRNGAPYRIAIAPIQDFSLAPQVEGIFTEQLHRYFLHTPGWQLSKISQADAILEICLNHFGTHLGSSQEDRPQSLDLELSASASLRNVSGNHYFFQNIAFRSETHYEVAETQDVYYAAIPLLTRDLVHQIGRAVCQPWNFSDTFSKKSDPGIDPILPPKMDDSPESVTASKGFLTL
ncbi:MAG: hypothetical protein LBD40_00520 [Puniceicoccales bacterium]|nr:hypothetical protein [Puniceicoccales bacterium]